LGDGYDLPTVKEWRLIQAALRRIYLPRHEFSSGFPEGPARLILEKFSAELEVRSLVEYSLMQGGLVEWVKQGQAWVGLGAPRPQFHTNLWDPLTTEVKPIEPIKRLPYFGFRLLRRSPWYLADKERVRYID
jgi:hypothetical protein